MNRRTFFLTTATAGVVAVAGCSGGSDDGSTDGGQTSDGSGTGDDDTGPPTLGESYEWSDSFVVTMALQGEEGPDELTTYYNDGDFRQEVVADGQRFELYKIDDAFYQLSGGPVKQPQCQGNRPTSIPKTRVRSLVSNRASRR